MLNELTQSSEDMEVRRKALSIVLSMTSSRNVEEVVLFLKKQVQRTQEQDYEKVYLLFWKRSIDGLYLVLQVQ